MERFWPQERTRATFSRTFVRKRPRREASDEENSPRQSTPPAMGTTAMVMYAPPTAPSPSRRQRTTRDTKVDRRTQALLDYFREVDAHTLEIEAGPKALQKVTKSRAQEQIGTASRDSESNVMARGHCVEPHPSRDIASPSALVPEAVQAKEDDSKETSPALGGLQSTAKRPATASTDAAVGADDAGGGLSVLERLL
eukprot:7378660-Prymnesium_polylepis.1